jgi:hypothetical protein
VYYRVADGGSPPRLALETPWLDFFLVARQSVLLLVEMISWTALSRNMAISVFACTYAAATV